MEELEKLQNNYDVLRRNYETAMERISKKEHECYELGRENERLWRVVENLSDALKGGR
mgnify:CR=1 FL=1